LLTFFMGREQLLTMQHLFPLLLSSGHPHTNGPAMASYYSSIGQPFASGK
jgi:hypothetical protein